ncbi:MAG TPA: NrdH-redoxin [Polaromonas sp.]|uniref:glutaredoxin family protein n=1 Tax=Polaromonas sp. UBA4122 TaxID=1947074 RepID=UPI000ED04483|nr:glutaredoxin family protein [Polaromonas sp. UBA4122]HAL38963.1 NrdH-redoxin [Polaromonas sp.]
MNPNLVQYFAPRALLAAVVIAGGLFSPMSQAQQVYRIVGPDGKVTFSDQPPPPASNAKVSAANGSSAGGAASAGLPFELRQVATKYPVTLYTGNNCAPCGAGRSLLISRGVPFTEKTVATNEDTQALQRMSGDSSLPFMTIGSQQLKGFSDAEWTQFLDAAGYPASSALPASYRRPAPASLVTVATPPAAPVAGAAAGTASGGLPARPAAQPNNNPAGIQF